jgi:hypothetical protein
MAVASCGGVVSKHGGWKQRHTYLGSAWCGKWEGGCKWPERVVVVVVGSKEAMWQRLGAVSGFGHRQAGGPTRVGYVYIILVHINALVAQVV